VTGKAADKCYETEY